ncbi:hypothetical protein [Streptomyces yangpuensis]|uniref:hypothetical protein n=1 Tax=Streptomyces yangpuensis TaxID=1648182 RepID=UPI00371EA979
MQYGLYPGLPNTAPRSSYGTYLFTGETAQRIVEDLHQDHCGLGREPPGEARGWAAASAALHAEHGKQLTAGSMTVVGRADQAAYPRLRASPFEEAQAAGRRRTRVHVDHAP